MIRAMPDSPAPPIPTKWTRPSRSAGSSSSGTGDDHLPPPAASSTIRASFSSASRGISPGGPGHAVQAVGISSRSGRVAATHSGGERGVVDEQATTGVDHRPRVEGLLAVADGQRHEDRRQPDAETSVTVLAPARQTTRSAAA